MNRFKRIRLLLCESRRTAVIVTLFFAVAVSVFARDDSSQDAKAVADLDREFQAAVKQNDADTISRILADDFVLVTGLGKVYTKADLLKEARDRSSIYEHQEDSQQIVRVWGNTAVVTAKLWANGIRQGKPFNSTLWFSDTYVRTPTGWRYVFGQASLPMPIPAE